MLIMHQPVAGSRGEMTTATKRRLRRERLSAAKDGVIIPYEGVSKPADPDAPKLTNTAKRRARQRKKYEQEMEAWAAGETGDEPRPVFPTFLASSRSKLDDDCVKSKRIKKKNKKRKEVEDGVGNGDEPKLKKKKKEDLGHIRFEENDTKEPALIKAVNIPPKKKQKHEIKNSKESIKEQTDRLQSERDETELKEPVIKLSKKKKKDKIKNSEESLEEQADRLQSELEATDPSEESSDVKLNKTIEKTDGTAEKPKSDKSNKPPKKRRFVLFVGNLAYNTTEEQVKEHFKKVGPIVSVRLAKPLDEGSPDTCRGFCHLEVTDEETYLKALSMTHTFMAKRRINVEYSGSQTQSAKAEQKKKNLKMNALRKSGNLFEVMNPTGSGGNKKERKNMAKRETQKQGNKFWV